MKVREVYGVKVLKHLGIEAITLYPFILYAEAKPLWWIVNHEWIHIDQVRRFGWFKFYLTYVLFYLENLIKYREHGRAYREIPWEKEAFNKQFKDRLEKII